MPKRRQEPFRLKPKQGPPFCALLSMSLTNGIQLLEQPRLRIGRASDCEVVLAHDSVSKRHVQLSRTEDGYELLDLKSVNGTTLNGLPLKEARALRDGPPCR